MSILLGDNMQYLGRKPLDDRIRYDTLADMVAMPDDTLYDGCLAYCVATDKTYQWKSTNPVDPDTGRWREFSSGGGGSVTVDDELSATSTNPVQNKVIKGALDSKVNTADLAAVATSNDYEDLDNLPAVPEKTSDLTNDSGFIDNTVANLVNYYTKQQTYTQAEVQALISAAVSGGFEVVESLPATGDSHTIYLMLKSPAGATGDIYDEYIYVKGAWERIGSTSIDLTQYQTKALLNSITVGGVEQTTVEGALAAINAALASYMTTAAFNTAIADYYTKTQVESLLDDKADKVSNATNGNFAGLDATGNLTDSGSKADDFLPQNALNIGGAKNLLDYTATSFHYTGGSNVIGTATLEPGEYVISVYQDNTISVVNRYNSLSVKKLPSGTVEYESGSDGRQEARLHEMNLTVSETAEYEIGYRYASNHGTQTGYVDISQPMVRVKGTDSTWAPRAQTNRELTANKQDKLTFDDVPTANSDNPVKSGGVYSVIGALSSLATSVKTSIVNAINELVNGKQDKMSAGTGISLTNDGKTINATNVLPLNYSTSEQVVGTWIDGKPLYQKTISCGALPNATTKDINIATANAISVKHIYGCALRNSDGMVIALPRSNPTLANNISVDIILNQTQIRITTGGDYSSFTETYITLQYTKTTDA